MLAASWLGLAVVPGGLRAEVGLPAAPFRTDPWESN
jgi:hypothetical protein